MKEIQVGSRFGRSNGSCHPIACFEQWPIKGLAVERDQHGPLCQPLGKRSEQRTFLTVLAHKQLLDFETSAFPPCETDQKGIRSCPAGESGCLRVEEEPLLRVCHALMGIRREKAQGRCVWNVWGVISVPTVQRKMFALAIPFHRSA